MKNLYAIVKEQLDRLDYMELLAGGAPQDEFSLEAREISSRIRPGMGASEIAGIMAEVFCRSFDTDDTPELFLPAAQAIASER